ncbi:hypothetical protein AAMO2058_000102500 [Amorphochlora amoebiformis]
MRRFRAMVIVVLVQIAFSLLCCHSPLPKAPFGREMTNGRFSSLFPRSWPRFRSQLLLRSSLTANTQHQKSIREGSRVLGVCRQNATFGNPIRDRIQSQDITFDNDYKRPSPKFVHQNQENVLSDRKRNPKGDKAGRAGLRIRVATYNILNPILATETSMPECSWESLDSDARLARVLAKIDGEVNRRAVICLQEVGLRWAGALHSFFQKRDYHFILSFDGSVIDDHMGCALAIPNDQFVLETLDITRVGSTIRSIPNLNHYNPNSNLKSNINRTRSNDRTPAPPLKKRARTVRERAGQGNTLGILGTFRSALKSLFNRFKNHSIHTNASTTKGFAKLPKDGDRFHKSTSLNPQSRSYGYTRERGRKRQHRDLGRRTEWRDSYGNVNTYEYAHGPENGEETTRNEERCVWISEWLNAMRRNNKLIFARLFNPKSNRRVCVATYHLPCAYRSPGVLALHGVQAVNWITHLAKGDPLIFAGDLNTKPCDPGYLLMTIPKPQSLPIHINNNQRFPMPLIRGKAWGISGEPLVQRRLKSVYRAAGGGKEPEFTTFSRIEVSLY